MTDQMKFMHINRKRNTYRARDIYRLVEGEDVEVLIAGESVFKKSPPPGMKWSVSVVMQVVETDNN